MANRFESLYLFIFFLVILFGTFFFNFKQRKRLEEYLSKHGVECEGEAKLIGYADRQGTIIKVSFQINGQTVSKTLVHDTYNWFSDAPEMGACIRISVLVDPLNTDRYVIK